MKLSRQLRWHTASPKSGAQIRMKIQPASVRMITRSPAHKVLGHEVAIGCSQLYSVIVLETRKGALA